MSHAHSTLQPPEIFEFSTCHDYLSAWADYRRVVNPRWTLGVWARQLGLSGTGVLTNFLAGRRVPSPDLTRKIAGALRLGDYEREYWEAMVESSQKNLSLRTAQALRKELIRIQPREKFREISYDDFRSISNPLAYAVREMVNLAGFQEDPEWIGARLLPYFETDAQKILSALEALLRIGLLSRDPGGKLVQATAFYETPTEIPGEATRNCHHLNLDVAKKALDAVHPSERHFAWITCSVRRNEMGNFKAHIENFLRETLKLYDVPNGDEVNQVNVQFFPVTRKRGESE